MIFLLLYLAVAVLVIVGGWKMFQKAGKPGWAFIVPIYNIIVWLEIINRPLWWIALYFIPIVNIVIMIIVINDTAKSFGKGVGYTLGLIFLPFIFIPMIGLGDAQYKAIERTPQN